MFGDPMTEAEMTAKRLDDLRKVDEMPAILRKAFRACDFHLVVPKLRRGVDLSRLVEMVQAIKTQADADEVNRTFVQMK